MVFIMFCAVADSFSQQQELPAANITLINTNLTEPRYEFSALTKWKNKIILVPQNRRNVIDSVYIIDSLEIENSLQKNIATACTAFAINNLKHTGTRKDSLYINNILLSNYDGIEAAVVKDDTIFFSLETDTSFCYLVKGIINEYAKSINILADTLHIPNTYNINNAGYESLALLPQKDSLIAFFECNKDTVNAKAFMFNTLLKGNIKPLEWNRPLYFRLTDVYALSDNELIGINHLFTSKDKPAERDAYIKNVNLNIIEKQLTNGGNIDTCFTQIITLTINNNKIDWQPVAFVSLDIADNYEGILPFKNGVLMVVDGEPGNAPSKLVYASLPK
jgi:hypothetical protein